MPSWAIVAGGDEPIHPEAERFMADRTGAQTIEILGPHTVMVSQSVGVADYIRAALRVPR